MLWLLSEENIYRLLFFWEQLFWELFNLVVPRLLFFLLEWLFSLREILNISVHLYTVYELVLGEVVMIVL